MILSGQDILRRGILSPCDPRMSYSGYTFGLGPAGYDLRLDLGEERCEVWADHYYLRPGEFILAAAQERFDMPNDLIGIVHDKSSLARRGVSVFNTVIEPGWRGFLTLEIVNHGSESITLVQGQGVAQVVFHTLTSPTMFPYDGKYQDQAAGPQGPR